jgi:hypothetical protein
MDTAEPQPTTKAAKDTMKDNKTDKTLGPSERSEPGKWLHMDIMEKEKMEWMTDVPLYPQNVDSSPGEGEKPREVRFSLDGLVIPRTVVLPVHLGLHHHGDEPQVTILHVYCHSGTFIYTCTCTCTCRCRACTDVHVHACMHACMNTVKNSHFNVSI